MLLLLSSSTAISNLASRSRFEPRRILTRRLGVSFQETLLFVSWGFCVELSKPFVLKPSVNQYRSIHSGNAANGQITSERSATPLLPDFMDSSKCYLHNYYLSAAYYYGVKRQSSAPSFTSTFSLFIPNLAISF
ncbi:uncharacterized protein LOC126615481 [Malus sylvestris]|uniref:uncharacterized protein LOC126615481 n=1 Tax=Malus sylvestris TaxID=3752 RepID=UPI0021AD3569|nr:uncharacterized protein LOC126615481 [Malus sylvestris]